MNHTIVRFENNAGGWAEFKCGACSAEVDLFDFDQIDVLEASEDELEFPCPECNVSMEVDDLTVDENREVAHG